ncbi:MAG TPA: pyroglutamyl-peptidase I [Candidatus Binataceae bacterium]|nr:pyroglutamyl-peptidase I [Candidatus Binataceae bacterium]
MARVILLTGFEPFGGERSNPSWEVAARLDRREINGATIGALRLPVNCRRASRMVAAAIERLAPVAVVGLGQAGGRPVLSLEKVALNLADERADRERDGGLSGKPVVAGGPDAYFTRLPLAPILRALKRHEIPAAMSLSAGVYVCNTAMYSALHALRRRRRVRAGFIHLPYTAGQAARHRAVASMSIETMTAGIEIALDVVARGL